MKWLKTLLKGEISLPRLYLQYMLLIPIILMLVLYSLSFFAVMPLAGAESAFYFERLAGIFIIFPYNLMISAGLWQSAGRYQGPKVWKVIGYLTSVLFLIFALSLVYMEYYVLVTPMDELVNQLQAF
jgi:hypothetical protein